MTLEQAKIIARRIKLGTRNTDILDLCDYVLLTPAVNKPVNTNVNAPPPGKTDRAAYMREYMRARRALDRAEKQRQGMNQGPYIP